MSIKFWYATGLTGGGVALDSYSEAALLDGNTHVAFAYSSSKMYFYVFDPTGTDVEDSPTVIRPDDYSSAGVWRMAGSPYGDIQVHPYIVSGLPITGGITGGDISKTAANTLTVTPVTCLDTLLTTQLYTTTNKTLTIPSVANTIYHIFIAKLLADGTCEFRAYTSEAAVASDGNVDKYRWIGYWLTNGSGNCREGNLVNGVLWWARFSENTINSTTTPPANITTSISLASHLPVSRVSEVMVGAVATGSSTLFIAVSGVSATAMNKLVAEYLSTGANDLHEWGSYGKFIQLVDGNIYWGDGTYSNNAGTAQLAIHAAKLRR